MKISDRSLKFKGHFSHLYMPMRAHLRKNEFKFVSITVMVLEVASFLVFIFGTLGAILGTYSGIDMDDFILLGFGGIFMALVLMSMAEFLQILMRIEHNTRKENSLLEKQMQVQKQEVAATKSIAMAMKKKPAKKKARKAEETIAPKKAAIKKPVVRKIKPKK